MIAFPIALESEGSTLLDSPAKRIAVGRGFTVRPTAFAQIRERPRRAKLEENTVPVFPRDRNLSNEKLFLLSGLVASAGNENKKDESVPHLT